MIRAFFTLSFLVVALVLCITMQAAADSCPPNSGNVSCCIERDGRGCGTQQVIGWTTKTTGDWKSSKKYCYPQDVNWCKNNMTGNRAHLVNTICDFVASGYDTNGWGGGDVRCCRLSPDGCP